MLSLAKKGPILENMGISVLLVSWVIDVDRNPVFEWGWRKSDIWIVTWHHPLCDLTQMRSGLKLFYLPTSRSDCAKALALLQSSQEGMGGVGKVSAWLGQSFCTGFVRALTGGASCSGSSPTYLYIFSCLLEIRSLHGTLQKGSSTQRFTKIARAYL